MVKVDGVYIGYGQIIINHPVGLIKNRRVAWPSIAIGNSLFRSKGFGNIVCEKIYELSQKQNCDSIEAGVFEFRIFGKKKPCGLTGLNMSHFRRRLSPR